MPYLLPKVTGEEALQIIRPISLMMTATSSTLPPTLLTQTSQKYSEGVPSIVTSTLVRLRFARELNPASK